MKNGAINTINTIRGLIISIFLTYAMSMLAPAAYAQVTKPSIDFNHNRTGFPLTGVHTTVTCETCHVGGLFKGTPTDCAGCHSPGRRVVAQAKSVHHMPTTATCETCHTSTISFTGARFNHLGVQPKACITCHNGLTAPGKKAGHVVTTLSCDSCHRTSAWIPAGFDHAPPLATCVTCHYIGGPAKGMNLSTHIPTGGQSCDSCHTLGFTTFLGAVYDHIGQTQCATCHITGQYGAKTKTSGHIPTGTITCDVCHKGTGFISFAGSTMNHDAVATTNCSTCHNGSYISQKGSLGIGAQSKQNKPNHIVTTDECGSCHLGRSSFAGGYLNHLSPPANVVINDCNSCHDGVHALGKTNSPTHNGTTAKCNTCHGTANNYTSFAGAALDHTSPAVIGVCGTCHLGQSAAVTKGSTHIPTSGNDCATCHIIPGNPINITFTAPLPTMHHSAVVSIACATCHNGSYLTEKGTLQTGALAQPIGHVVTNGAACNSCHTVTDTDPLGWKNGTTYNHAGVTPTTCGTCHIPGTSGALKLSSRTTHIPVSGNACDACHVSGYTTFAGAKMYHAAVTSISCVTCHNGSYLSEKGTLGMGAQAMTTISNHIPVSTTVCSVCHTGTAYTSFTSPLASSTIMHTTGINTSSCKACHAPSPSYLGVTGQKVTVGQHQGSKATDDCSQSGCHKPLGNTGTAYISFP